MVFFAVAAALPAQPRRVSEPSEVTAVIRSLNALIADPNLQASAELFGSEADIWVNECRLGVGPAEILELLKTRKLWTEGTPPKIQQTQRTRLLGAEVAIVDAIQVQYGSIVVKSETAVTVIVRKLNGNWRIESLRFGMSTCSGG